MLIYSVIDLIEPSNVNYSVIALIDVIVQAEVLFGSPWLVDNGATSPAKSAEVVYNWIQQVTHQE